MPKRMSIYQFFILMVLFQYGSIILYFLTPDVKQDMWIAYLIYSLVGILFQFMYITVYEKYPEDTLVTYLPKIYGKIIGNILAVAYIAYFVYIASNIFREFLELTSQTSLEYTPKIFFGLVIASTVIYVTYCGIETLASMAQLYVIVLILIKITSFILILMTPDVFHISNIKPVLSNGVIYLLKNSWKLAMVPYGGNVVFTMIYPIISENKKIKKFASLAVITEGVILSINSILFIGTLGVDFATRCNFPLLETYRIIDVGDFLTRLDIIFVLSFLVDGFFRISVFMYVAAVGVSGILKLKNTKPVSIVLGIIMFIASFIISKSFTQQMYIGHNFIMRYIHFPIQVIITILTLVVYNVRKNHVKKLKYPKKV